MACGEQGEREAEAYLARLGYATVARNHRAADGEVDLIMRDDAVLVFVEVRTRSDPTRGTAIETIDRRKRARIVAAARSYLDETKESGPMRFDVVGITGLGEERELVHVVDAFEVGD